MSGVRSDVVVLGAGVIGLSCALALLRAGRAVTVLDRGSVGEGCSRGNCGTITPSHLPLHAPGTVARALRWMLRPDAPLYIKPRLDPQLLGWMLRFAGRCNERDFRRTARIKAGLLHRARACLAELIERERLDCEFAATGTLYVWRDGRALAQAQGDIGLLAELGVAAEPLDAGALRAREPSLRADVVGGHWHPGDAQLRPERYVAALAAAVRAAGGTVREGCPVHGLRVENGRVTAVAAAGDTFAPAAVVLATGAWSPGLGRMIGMRLPIQPGKGYSITYTRPRLAPHCALVLEERSVCVSTWGSGYRLGSTMEFSGYDDSLNPRRLAALRRAAAEYLLEPEGPAEVERWWGWRPMTYDDLPLIGRWPRCENLTIATGHGMLGVTLSAVTGQIVADVLCGRAPDLDLAPLRPERFGVR